MKFLCIECDEAMKLLNTANENDGSLSIIYSCPKCSRRMAMLTNSMETQMVKSMDVQIGGRESSSQPMGKLRSSLLSKNDNYSIEKKEDDHTPTISQADSSDPKCPFPGMVSEMEKNTSAQGAIAWTPEAKERIQRIPEFVREMVRKGIEQHAKEKGYSEINQSVMDEVKGQFGM